MTNDILTQPPADSSLAQHLLVMTLGVAQTHVLCVAAQLGLADRVKDGPKSVEELAEATANRLLWYLVPPAELVKNVRKTFR